MYSPRKMVAKTMLMKTPGIADQISRIASEKRPFDRTVPSHAVAETVAPKTPGPSNRATTPTTTELGT